MTTILPQKNIDSLKKYYKSIFTYRFLGALAIIFLIWLIFEGTIFYILSNQKDILLDDYDSNSNASKVKLVNDYKEKVSESKIILKLFETDKYKKSEILKFVLESDREGIVINNISVEEAEDLTFVGIGGVAENRDILSEYKTFFDQNERSVSVDLPVSSFTKTFDIPFTITFIYENKE